MKMDLVMNLDSGLKNPNLYTRLEDYGLLRGSKAFR